ncbi:Nitrous oxide reductase accessory protein NosL [Halovenus aranensis]|uniref:Nitrous oxide reductase accessory protein NosL n=1 Tax=Halovenus aranensis TaxID=890420 RepID=A0A1G8YGP0_9EURY|nr:nitrous oxide reductase accessory protein NosL [Halovenus aranensis]SDK01230.1 Nitrous oxide reductase accessory protein NosL [Halovenus aranensis]
MHRRTFLRGSLAATGTSVLAGCTDILGSDEEGVPEPVPLSGGKFDYQGGMEIGPHGGPNGQIFYADNEPQPLQQSEGEGDPSLAWFHTLADGLFPYHFERRDRGWEAEVVYVTDYTSVDWSLTEREGRPRMPSPTAPETFADATELTYVVNSDVAGGMGPDLFPFSADGDADAFVDDHGGQTLGYDDITRQLLSSIQANG